MGLGASYASQHGSPLLRAIIATSVCVISGLGYSLLRRGRGQPRRERRKLSKTEPRDVMRLVRRNILELQPYRCARDDYSEGILLDANENSHGSALPANEQHQQLNRYPDPYQHRLKSKIAQYRCVKPEQIFVGVGSDEAIDILIRIFCEPGRDSIIITPPTYGMYTVSARTNDVDVVRVPLTPTFEVRIPEVLAAINGRTKLIFLCSPGNPTAKLIPLEVTRRILKEARACIVVVDEAYIDFAQSGDVSACAMVDQFPNLIVLQTLSKAFGLAAIRCGMAIGNPEVVQIMNNVKAPYNINALTSQLAYQAFEHIDILHTNVKNILKEKERIVKALLSLDQVTRIHHSDTNFILFEVPQAQKIYADMAQSGIVARYRGNELHCKDCIRLTVGTPHENDSFLQMFEQTADRYLVSL